MGTRTGAQRPGNGLGARAAVVGPEAAGAEALVSGSEQDSDSGDDEDAGEDGRSVKRERLDKAALHQGPRSGVPSGASGGSGSGLVGVKPGKKTRGRVKIKMEFIDNKLRRYTTFSKRKTGIMKKQGLRLLVLHVFGRWKPPIDAVFFTSPSRDLNRGPSCCEARALTTAPPCSPSFLY
uniref:MADS-box domain-containing protein n=1 Tax=Oryzias latipes TaxID=8090 RepID=A0A3P9MRB6_ORYLA